ncbi:MAG: fungal-specific transcription factor domain-containing protein, partial [Benjaminiella poitrasii]
MNTNKKRDKSEEIILPIKRTRAKRSCDFCRKRKARCDADQSTPCSNCRAWGFKCEFLAVRKKRGPPSVYVENLEKKCKKMETLLTKLTNMSIEDIEKCNYQIKSCLKESPVLTSQRQNGKLDNHMETDENKFEDKESSDDDKSISSLNTKQHDINEIFSNMKLDDYDSIKYTGHSAGLQLLSHDLFKSKPCVQWPGRDDIAIKLMPHNELLVVRSDNFRSRNKTFDTQLGVGFSLNSSIFDAKPYQHNTRLDRKTTLRKKLLTSESMPSHKMIEEAYQLYFTHIHTFLPIVHRPRFEAHDKTTSNILTNAVLAVAFRFASLHFPKLFNSKKSALHANIYFKKVTARLQDLSRGSLRHVQAALLMALFLDMDETDVETMQWYMLGKAIRMAQDIGLHRSSSNWDFPPSEIETRHRVFYVCYVLDRLMSARAGKPLTILDREFDTDLPVPYEVFDDKSNTETSIYHSFISLIKLCEILGRILKALYAPKSKHSNTNTGLDDPTIVAVLDRRLKNWKASLEQPADDTIWSKAEKVNLFLFYYTATLLLHRPFIEFPIVTRNPALTIQESANMDVLAAESRQACENAANNISVIILQKQSLMSDPDSYAPLCLPTCFIYVMFQSSLIHLAIAIKDRQSSRRLRSLQKSVTLLKQYEQLVSAQRAYNILKLLIVINNIDIDYSLDVHDEYGPLVLKESDTSHQNVSVDNNTVILGCEEDDATPKSSWCQRLMNTSIVGGITDNLYQ